MYIHYEIKSENKKLTQTSFQSYSLVAYRISLILNEKLHKTFQEGSKQRFFICYKKSNLK